MTDRIVSPSIYKRVKTSRICVENQGTIFICLLLFVAVWFVFNKFEQFIITPPLSHVVDFITPSPNYSHKNHNQHVLILSNILRFYYECPCYESSLCITKKRLWPALQLVFSLQPPPIGFKKILSSTPFF